jgi:hypothetical protein
MAIAGHGPATNINGENGMMLKNLLIGLPIMLLCLVIQTGFVFWSVRYFAQQAVAAQGTGTRIGLRPLLIAVLTMFLGTVVQITVWGTLFVMLGEIDELYEAIYHSAVNFSSLGYGDFVMSKDWKLLGPLEAVCGVLMLGMTAAALTVILQQMVNIQREAAPAARR